MSAETLRKAAERLRERAGAATPGPWFVEECGDFGDKSAALEIARWRGFTNTVNLGEDRPTADYIATMHPGVGLALADWLDTMASIWDGGGKYAFGSTEQRALAQEPKDINPTSLMGRAVTVAHLILGGAS